MFELLDQFAERFARIEGPPASVLQEADILIIPKPKPGSYGIPFGEEVLMMDYDSDKSYRVKVCNLGFHKKITARKTVRPFFPRAHLAEYFSANCDNPYALSYVLARMIGSKGIETPLTRVPPISTHYPSVADREGAIERLLLNARLGDSVFSRPVESSPVSRLIRKIDSCQFSHVGCCLGDGITVDAGPNGILKTSLADTAKECHVALYRPRFAIGEDGLEKMKIFAEQSIGGGYNWLGVLEVLLRKKLGFKPRVPSVRNTLFSDGFQLVAYV